MILLNPATYDLDPNVWAAVLMTGSGTAAVESMTAALIPANGRLLNLENGVYGDRIAQICSQYGIAHERAIFPWMHPLDLDAIAARLDAAQEGAQFTHMAAVHHETTTGRLNDLRPLGKLCRERGLRLIVDAVSSFGAEPIDFADDSLCVVAATANKCLHATASRTYYLDLGRLARMQDQRNTPFTPAVHAYYALVEALREFADEGGRAARYKRYAALAEQVRAGLTTKAEGIVIYAGRGTWHRLCFGSQPWVM
ncbi:MAG TPA: aminotransferase class V-fold PLP-dependent enzyme [Steroidobacteraceae bacterium]|jgi:2-aminoethylphosphonate-pyruvate transaminase|nr:aminotransferase class V-fold PLP-dependent enzyme [Steroidobacteraceae bacterium]